MNDFHCLQGKGRFSALGSGPRVSDGGAMPATADSPEKRPVRSLLAPEIERAFAAMGQPAYRAKQVLRWLYEKRVRSFEEMTDLPAPLRTQLSAAFAFDELEVIRKTGSKDTTQKFLFRL